MTKTYKQKLESIALLIDPALSITSSEKKHKKNLERIIRQLSDKNHALQVEIEDLNRTNNIITHESSAALEVIKIKRKNNKLNTRVLELESYIKVFGE